MKRFLLAISILLMVSCQSSPIDSVESICHGGTFVGNVTLSSQQEVNEFSSNCFTKIIGGLHISEPGNGINDITDLSGLESLIEVFPGQIFIRSRNLTNLSGLHNIVKVGGLTLSNCWSLENIRDLNSLNIIGDFESGEYMDGVLEGLKINDCISLIDLDGLQSVTAIKNIYIAGNTNLESLEGLNNLNTLGIPFESEAQDQNGYLTVGRLPCPDNCNENSNLTDVCVLQNLFTLGVYNPNKVSIKLTIFPPNVELGVQEILAGICSF